MVYNCLRLKLPLTKPKLTSYLSYLEPERTFPTKPLTLTLYRPAMPLGNRKKYFLGSFQFSIVSIHKISPL